MTDRTAAPPSPPRGALRRQRRLTAVALSIALAALQARADEPLADAATLKQLDAIAVRVAKAGRDAEVVQLVDLLLALGMDPTAAADLVGRCNGELARARTRKDALPAEAKALRRIAADLAGTLATLDADAATRLARAIVLLDGEVDAAQMQLGRVRLDGRWQPAGAAQRAARRDAMQIAMHKARQLSIDIEVTPCADELAVALIGAPAHTARCGGLTIHSAWPADKLDRTLREVLRAVAWFRATVDGELRVHAPAGMTWIAVPSMTAYQRALPVLRGKGLLSDSAAANAGKLTGWQLNPALAVVYRHTEVSLETSVLSRLLDDLSFGDPPLALRTAPPTLRAGLENWLCLNWFGSPMIGRVYFEDGEMATRRATGGSSAPLDRARQQMHDELMRMAQGGILGVRSWMAYLVARGEDPRWTQTFRDQLGKMSGPELLKTTLVYEYLTERGPTAAVFGRLAAARGALGADPTTCLSAAVDGPLDEFELEWREWLRPVDGGLAARLDGNAALDRSAAAALAAVNALRQAALARLPDSPPKTVSFDPDLAAGCRAHARYLGHHADQASQWPGIHEELPDRAGFSTAGAWAAANGLIATGARTEAAAIDAWMGGFYHRLPLLRPGVIRIGFALEQGVAVLDAKSLVAPLADAWLVVWPAPQATDVPRSFSTELPNPVPDADQRRFGYCVTVQRSARIQDDDTAAGEITLREGGPDGPPVDGYLTTPTRPLNPDLVPPDAYAFIPGAKLKARTAYHATFRIGDDKPFSWSFTTGSR